MSFLSKRKEEKQVATIEEVRKAYEALSQEDKETFKQTLRDREDESVAAQERESGTEDTQTAKDRIDEATGEEKAHDAEKRAEESVDAAPEAPQEPAGEDKGDGVEEMRAEIDALKDELRAVKEAVFKAKQTPKPVDDERQKQFDELACRYGG